MLDLRSKIRNKNDTSERPKIPILMITPSWELSRDLEAQRRTLLEFMRAELAVQTKGNLSFRSKLKAVTPSEESVGMNLQDGGPSPHRAQEHEGDQMSAKRIIHLMQTDGYIEHHNFANRFRQRDR